MDTQARSQREELLTVAPNGKGRADADEKVPYVFRVSLPPG
jgi:hypothetical protein